MSTTNQTAYNYKVVRQFAIMTVVWGIVGMAVGVLIAAQLVWPDLNLGLPWTSFGRLRPLHTNAVIF
ncbi:cytochrome C oxidase Cbb3, partial [Pseudomonas sp. ATCC 13867]